MHPHGLVYPPDLLDVLPVLEPQQQRPPNRRRPQATPTPHPHPIRALSAKQFSDLHLQHTLAHPPDNALFPFLHGLEGDNHAQNTFFASSSFATAAGSGVGYNTNSRHHHHHHHDGNGNANNKITPRVPHYRGLVWVVCEEDVERAGDYTTLRVLRRKPVSAPTMAQASGARGEEEEEQQELLDAACAPSSSESSEECSDGSSSYGDEDEELEMEMALDEDEQDMLLMLEARNTAAAVAAAAKAKVAANKVKNNMNNNNDNDKASNDSSSAFGSPDLDLDIDLDDDDEDSVLASPVLNTGIGVGMMQMDAVRVVVQGESESLSADGRLRSSSSAGEEESQEVVLAEMKEDGILDAVSALKAKANGNGNIREMEKAESHFEGTHMHPVAARRTAVSHSSGGTTNATIGTTTTTSGSDATLPLPLPIPMGLGIDTSGIGGNAASQVQPRSSISPLSPLSSSSSSSTSSSSSSFSESANSNSISNASSYTNTHSNLSSSTPGSTGYACGSSSPLSQVHSQSQEQDGEQEQEQEGEEPLSLLELDLDSRSRGGPEGEDLEAEAEGRSASLPAQRSPESTASPPPPPAPTTPTTTGEGNTKKSRHTLTPRATLRVSRPTDPSCPPLLTSTFRPKELLRRSKGVGKVKSGVNERRRKGDTGMPRLRVDVGSGQDKRKEGQEEECEDEEEGGWEFVPARVPDGISLRNFGIQVPIYATLSDIVIYSPYGATPAALALARRFRSAIRAKRAERLDAAGLGASSSLLPSSFSSSSSGYSASYSYYQNDVEDQNGVNHYAHTHNHRESEEELKQRREEFLQYNVFVLDAAEDDMRKEVPHLMMRVCGAGVPGGSSGPPSSLSASSPSSSSSSTKTTTQMRNGINRPLVDVGAHTDGPDGHVVEQERMRQLEELEKEKKKRQDDGMGMDMDMDMIIDMHMGGDAMDVDEVKTPDDPDVTRRSIVHEQEVEDNIHDDDLHLILNTVDFALREREEMRDLTKASEIISLPPIVPGVSGSASTSTSISQSTSRTSKSTAHIVDAESDLATPVWDPRVGQVYLGNSGDVPLAPDVPSQFRHAASIANARARGGREEEQEEEKAKWDWTNVTSHLRSVDGLLKEHDVDLGFEEPFVVVDGEEIDIDGESKSGKPTASLAEDDPFNYLATNDPVHGFGYDICVECHDLAPFPSAAHLRAAEEHLGMLDVMWRERWERAWAERVIRLSHSAGEKGMDEEEQTRIRTCPAPPTPPRPPPHANAVIHLPFPSSPSNTQATMVALMPIVRFLEKWIQPLPVPVIAPPPPLPVPTSTSAGGGGGASSSSPIPTPTPAPASSRRWSSVTSLIPSFPSFPGVGSSSGNSSNNNASNTNTTNAAPTPPPNAPLPPHPARVRSMTSPSSSSMQVHPPTPVQARSRPLKILLYSSDGYTESSVPALCLLMAIKSLMLPEAYLELQVEKRRSFFVYQTDLGVLRRVEGRLKEEREREKEKERERERERERMAVGVYLSSSSSSSMGGSINANGKRTAGGPAVVPARGGYWSGSGNSTSSASAGAGSATPSTSSSFMGRPAAKSVSFAHAPGYMASTPSAAHYSQQQQQQPQHQISVGAATTALVTPSSVVSSQQGTSASQFMQKPQFEFGSLPATPASPFTTQQPQPQPQMMGVIKGRPRASTSPWLPSLFGGDHQSWFNDPRFDGSFPSRVLPFLYLGNLNHASNVYMLHALGITHVVSVGECALVPPPHHMAMHGGGGTSGACHRPGPGAHFVQGKGPGGHGSLWIEEREGRIKVLDIKGVCDDGIDTLEPQLEPICDWIDKARQEGGQVLVHCRVGVSRSATVTIAYVMKHLSLPLVDAYLIVRSRRLSVLIQPNMRLLYNLCGWEIKLAKERAGGDERKLKKELARTLTWPYLSKEVHALNEKYLH